MSGNIHALERKKKADEKRGGGAREDTRTTLNFFTNKRRYLHKENVGSKQK